MPTKSGPEGRKASFIEEARRAQLIQCAIDTIAELGFAQASVAQIAGRAGISKSVITYYFSGKDELIRQVLTQIFTDAHRYIAPRVGAEQTVRLRLQAYIRAHIEFISTHLTQMAAVMEIAANHRTEDGSLRWGGTADRPVRTALEGMLARGQESGEFGAFDRSVMAVAIRRAIDALPPLMMSDPAVDAEVYARELVALFDRATRKESNG
ncbi:MAG TPA: TetR/AcrR family transcriptional regulator [Candidatus Dormibacteraeota bacterium]|nr:TetR/AcrR family transcriptional regulator [Candidatus Dormibacteraeota bacterium]